MIPGRKRIILPAISLLVLLSPFHLGAQTSAPGGARKSILLNSGWEFRQDLGEGETGTATWRSAQVPGAVHTDLLNHKLIPDLYYRDNEAKLQWIENAEWEYRNTIQASPEILSHRNIELVFEGLDTIADVYVNEKKILSADNMFCEWRVDVKANLKPGANSLRVVFHSVFPEMQKLIAADPFHSQVRLQDKTYIRKAAYEYGWDWGPRFVTSGIWRPVRLELWDAARIADLHVAQKDVTMEVANVVAQIEVISSVSGTATVEVDYSIGAKTSKTVREVHLHPGVNPVDISIAIASPELWFPAGYGPQPLYEFHARIVMGKVVADEATIRTGLRSVVLRRDLDQWGRSFEFVVNGIPIFAKGADVIPIDSIPSRESSQQIRGVLQSARDANMNMIRHWGGGYYESQEFYDVCDELGIMIWQDFMFATPIPDSIRDNVTREAEYQVRRLRNHPSIVFWSGNNELESSWGWGPGSPYAQTPPEGRVRAWIEYMELFSGILPRTIARLTPETPYMPSSPSADYESTSETFQSGDDHNWSVWHGNKPFTEYEKTYPRFMSEYGFQSFPELRTLEAVTRPEDRDLTSPILLAHEKNATNGIVKISESMARYYAVPRDFASFVYVSQLMQAEAIKIGAEHLRRNRPRVMGSIIWQLNDCWPVISWASIDYFNRWKALQYYARRFYNELLVSPHVETGSVAVYVVSDRTTPVSANLRVRLLTFGGAVLVEKIQPVEIPALSSKAYLQLPLAELNAAKGYDATQSFLSAELVVDGKTASSNLLFFALPKDLQLPAPQISSELTKMGDSYRLRLTSIVLARNVYISAGNLDVAVSDNYFDLLPGQAVELTVKGTASLDQLRSALKIVTQADAFSRPAPTPAVR